MEKGLKKDFNLDFYLKYVLAIGLLFSGVDKFFAFNPFLKFTGEASLLMKSLDQAGFTLPFVGSIEILAGILLIRKNTTPQGLIMLLPFSISIMLFHLFLAPSQIWPALFVFVLNIVLIYRDRIIYSPIFKSITIGEDEVKRSISKVTWVRKPKDKK